MIVEEGGDYVFSGEFKPPYDQIDYLGNGRSGTVDAVKDIHTGVVYARKTIRLRGSRQHKEDRRRAFDNEIKIIRDLGTHHHIIRVFATYYEEPKLCLILQPVADKGDLDTFIHSFRDNASEWDAQIYDDNVGVLRRAFGCLASGLAFMHRKRIRHKDINGRNILVHQGSVIYTDFGISKSFSEADNSTTEGPVLSLTRRYSAPEILDHGRRNSKSDVFSLGCVYLELLSALTSVPVIDYSKLFAEDSQNLADQIRTSTMSHTPDSSLAELALSMISAHHDQRPKSSEVDMQLRTYTGHICDECQIPRTPDPELVFTIPLEEPLSRHTTFASTTSFLDIAYPNDSYSFDSPLSWTDTPSTSLPYNRRDYTSASPTVQSPYHVPSLVQATTSTYSERDSMTHNDSEASPMSSDIPGLSPAPGDGFAAPVDGTKHGHWTYSAAHHDWYYAAVNSDNKGTLC